MDSSDQIDASRGVKVAFLGIGIMGLPMANRLLDAGFSLRVWNRTRTKTAPLAELGARIAATPTDCVVSADFVVLMLESGPVVESVLFDSNAVSHMERVALVIDMTSSDPRVARDQASRLIEKGIGYVDAPVSGGPYGAEEGSLAIMAGARAEDFARALPILKSLGTPTLIGPPGSGQVAKLCSQIILGAALGGIADSLLLARAVGASPERVREALLGGFADSKVLRIHGERMLKRDFVPGGHVRTHLKDIAAASAIAQDAELNLPTLQLVNELLGNLASHGYEGYDNSAVILEVERRNKRYRLSDAPDRAPN